MVSDLLGNLSCVFIFYCVDQVHVLGQEVKSIGQMTGCVREVHFATVWLLHMNEINSGFQGFPNILSEAVVLCLGHFYHCGHGLVRGHAENHVFVGFLKHGIEVLSDGGSFPFEEKLGDFKCTLCEGMFEIELFTGHNLGKEIRSIPLLDRKINTSPWNLIRAKDGSQSTYELTFTTVGITKDPYDPFFCLLTE